MRPLRRLLVPQVLGAPVLVAVLLAGCARDDAAPAPGPAPGVVPDGPDTIVPERAQAIVRVGLARDPTSIDPRHVADDEGALVVRALFDGLVDHAPDGSLVPAAAEGWTIEDGGSTVRFVLREDRFHDGSPVTAQDHADALLAVLDPDRPPFFREDLVAALRGAVADPPEPTEESAGGGEDAGAEEDAGAGEDEPSRWGLPSDVLAAGGVEVVDARTLVLRLERPDPLLLHRLADPVLVPLPDLAVDDPEAFAREPVGNGPFRMVGPREPGAFIRLGASTDHPRPPRIDELVLQVYAGDVDGTQRWTDLLADRLRITAVPAALRGEARQRFGTPLDGRRGPGLHELPLASVYAYGFDVDAPVVDDVLLRRAVSAAIDRRAIADALAAAGAEPADALVPDHLAGTPPDCAHCRHDVELATALMERWRAGREEGTPEPPLTLTYPRGTVHVAVAERIAADVEEVLGLEVRLQSREFGTLVRAVRDGRAPLFRLGLRAGLGGGAAAVSMLDPALRPGDVANWTGWEGSTASGLLDGWTPAASDDVVRAVERALLEDAAVVPILWTRPDLVVHPAVGGFHLDPTGRWWPELLHLR